MTVEQPASSCISKVSVYRSSALISRVAKVQFTEEGDKICVLIPDLPTKMIDSSVRVNVINRDGVQVENVNIEVQLGVAEGPELTDIEAEMRSLVKEKNHLELDLERQRRRVNFLESLKAKPVSEAQLPESVAFSKRLVVQSQKALGEYVYDELIAARRAMFACGEEFEALNEKVRKLYEKRELESSALNESLRTFRKAAVVTLKRLQPCEHIEVELSYLVPDAVWYPRYDFRVTDGSDQAELTMSALVAQATGENWEDVDLYLSTSNLHRSTAQPTLDSWRIGRAQPPKPTGWRPLPDSSQIFNSYDHNYYSPPEGEFIEIPDLPELKRLGSAWEEIDDGAYTEPMGDISQVFGAIAESAPEPEPDYDDESPCDEEFGDELGMSNKSEQLRSKQSAPSPSRPAKKIPMGRRSAPKASPSQPMEMDRAMSKERVEPECSIEDQEFGFDQELSLLTAGDEALAYSDLRLQGADEGYMRGQLKATGFAEKVTETLKGRKDSGDIHSIAKEEISGALRGQHLDRSILNLPPYCVQVSSSAGHFDVTYDVDQKGNIPANNQIHKAKVLSSTPKVKKVYRCVPRADTTVYQYAVLENPLRTPLLSGPVRIFLNGEFIVDSPLSTTPPGKKIELNLGVESGISVIRNTHYKETSGGLLGGDLVLQHQIEIKVKSNLSSSALVEIFERIPITTDDEIKIKLTNVKPEAKDYNQTERGGYIQGGRKFSIEMAPREEKICTLEYEVVISKDLALNGGNRRE